MRDPCVPSLAMRPRQRADLERPDGVARFREHRGEVRAACNGPVTFEPSAQQLRIGWRGTFELCSIRSLVNKRVVDERARRVDPFALALLFDEWNPRPAPFAEDVALSDP